MAVGRVTERGVSQAMLGNLQLNLSALQRLQERLSSGRLISRPSDSPGGTVSALHYRGEIRRAEQHQRNAQDGLNLLGLADTTITESLSLLARAGELLSGATNGAIGAEERAAIASEVDHLRQSLVSLANTTYLGRPVFAGAANGTRAYADDGTYLGVPPGTAGDQIERTIADGVRVRVNLTGPEVFGPAGADLFATLADIADHLRNDPSQLIADKTRLDAAAVTMKTALASVGARYHRVETMRDRNESLVIDRKNNLAEVESIDLPATMTELKLQEVAYEAALAATARTVRSSLVDFLR